MFQTSFFAPPSDLNGTVPAVTAPAVSGLGVGLPCLFPQPLHDTVPYALGTGFDLPSSECRSDFLSEVCRFHSSLDASRSLPFGGVRSVRGCSGMTFASAAVFRE